jgi:uncharacterized LabA/DUF88 family protein
MFKVNVYIDGFNLYHAIDELNDDSLKWVDLWKLSENILNRYQTLGEVKYFSAYATWRPDSYKRHRDYVTALQSRGVCAIMGRFKERRLTCKALCKQVFLTHEEKETDVNIGAHLIADALQNKFDTALVVTADTDLAAVVKLARTIVSEEKRIATVAPPRRFARARELEHLFEITKGKIRSSQLQDLVETSAGTICRPDKYRLKGTY